MSDPMAADNQLNAAQMTLLRGKLLQEAHARPSLPAPLPAQLTHYAFMHRRDGQVLDPVAQIEALCAALGTPAPDPDAWRHQIETGRTRLIWERHTEMSTLTLMEEGPGKPPFSGPPELGLPGEVLDQFGDLLSATRLDVQPSSKGRLKPELARQAFGENRFIASAIGGGDFTVATDFKADATGAVRFILFDPAAPDDRRGRVVQKLLEVDAYRIAALLALPLAQALGQELNRLENALDTLSAQISEPPQTGRDKDLLERLSRIAGEVTAADARTHYRFAASRAYDAVMRERLTRLREERVEGYERLSVFLERRQAPAMRTCEAAQRRLDARGQRVTRANQLLATRVNVALEDQNAALLASMDQRARLQLRLQETVEGLSTVAITYYGTGLAHYLFKGVAGSLWPELNVALATALVVPVIFGGVWLALQRVKRSLRD